MVHAQVGAAGPAVRLLVAVAGTSDQAGTEKAARGIRERVSLSQSLTDSSVYSHVFAISDF